MKKGFTLVEIISVLVVLAVIALIAVPTVNSSIKDSKEKSYNSQVEVIIKAAKQWAIDNNSLLPSGDETYKLSLNVLISEKYINNVKDGKLKNPKDPSKTMDGCVYITYSNSYNQYIYEYKDEC